MLTEYRLVTLIAQDYQETLLGSTSFCITSADTARQFLELFTWNSGISTEKDFISFCQANSWLIKPLNRIGFPIKLKNYLQGSLTCDSLATYLDARIEAGF